MTFRELLTLYKEGKLDEKTRLEVEESIEREDAILEYLSERDEIDGLAYDGADTDSDERQREMEKRFGAELTRRIRRAFIRLGVSVGAVLLAVMLLIEFVLPKAVDRFYYNPGEIVASCKQSEEYGKGQCSTSRMSLDMAVYSELFLPLTMRSNVSSISHGYGDYDIIIVQNLSYTGHFTDVGGHISKGELILYDNNTLKPPAGNSFEWTMNMKDPEKSLSEQIAPPEADGDGFVNHAVGMAGYPDEARERLSALQDGEMYQGFVSLDSIMDYDAFFAFLEEQNLTEVWCAVQVDESPSYASNYGFNTYMSSGGNILCWDFEKYPLLSQNNLVPHDEDNPIVLSNESDARQHMLSLLRYLSDQKAFLKMMENHGTYISNLEDKIDYVNEHGIQVYGFSLIADKETLLKLMDCPEVYSAAAKELR